MGNQKAIVTGGAGCIGSELAEMLLNRGDAVTVIDNLSSGKEEHLNTMAGRPGFRFLELDLLDFDAVRSALAGADIVYHLAANPDVKFVGGDRTDKDLQQNTFCTYNVLEAMRQQAVKCMVFSSTSAVYGVSERQPIAEDSPMHPISLYGATKLGCEALIHAFHALFGMQAWIFRFANIVGPKVRKQGRTVIGDFVYKLKQDPTKLLILGDGKQAKSYLLSTECVNGMLFAIEHAPAGVNTFNLGCAGNLSVQRIAEMVVASMGLRNVHFDYTGGEGGWPGDVPRFQLDVSAINRLGWKAKHDSEEAVAQAVRASLERHNLEAACKP